MNRKSTPVRESIFVDCQNVNSSTYILTPQHLISDRNSWRYTNLETTSRIKTGRFWPFWGNQFLQKSDAVYIHRCEHIMMLQQSNRVYLCRTEIERWENIFISEHMLNKMSIYVL